MTIQRPKRLLAAVGLAMAVVLGTSQAAFAAHAVRHHGSGHIDGTWFMDFDRGVFNALSGEDMQFGVTSQTLRYLEPDGTARIRKIGATRPSYRACKNASLLNKDYNVANVAPGTWFCFKTQRGRFARFRLDHVEPYPGGIDITYTTWEF